MALLKSFGSPSFSVVSFLFRRQQFRVSCFRSTFTLKNKMNCVYFHECEKSSGDFLMTFTFEYTNDVMNMSKAICLNRNVSESLDVLLTRLKSKLELIFLKKSSIKKKKKNIEAEELQIPMPDFEPQFLLNDEPLSRNVVLRDVIENSNGGSLKLKILDRIYSVIINAPLITAMSLPEEVFIGSPCYPNKFVGFSINKQKSTFTWFKSTTPHSKWEKCGEGFYYIPTNNDLNYYLKIRCLPLNNYSLEGPECEAVSSSAVTGSLGIDEILKRQEFTKEATAVDEIRIVSYNILADMYVNTKEAKTTLFTYCDPDILNLNYRKNLWNYELLGYKADFICLQEVDTKVFESNFQYLFEHQGLKGVYHEKKALREGCALFYNLKKFELLSCTQHSYSEELLNNPLLKDFCEKINKALRDRLDNVQSLLQIGAFKCLTNENQLIVVGNTHMYFHPDADHIRLLQGVVGFRMLLNKVEELKKLYPEKNASVILCGDFNSTRECGFHTFLNEGRVDSSHPEWTIKESEEIEGIACENPLKMKSAYGTPKYTNYTKGFKECLDYIYFQTDHLELKQIVPIPSEEILSQYEAIPSKFFPSDHVALIADLKFRNK